MKKYMLMAAAAIAVLSSCTKENGPADNKDGGQTPVFTATMEDIAGLTRATFNSTDKKAEWESGDEIVIEGVTGAGDVIYDDIFSTGAAGATATFGFKSELFYDNTYQKSDAVRYDAYFPASLYTEDCFVLPAAIEETYAAGRFNMPMFASSATTDLEFQNLCGVLAITVRSNQVSSVKKIRVSSSNRGVSGEMNPDIMQSDPDHIFAALDGSSVSDPAKTLTVTYTDAVATDATGKVFYVAVPPSLKWDDTAGDYTSAPYRDLKIEIDPDGNGFIRSMTTKSGVDIVIERSKIYEIAFEDNSPLYLPGKFSVSATKQVYFSKGNLQATYDGSKYAWGFAADQYNFVGNAAGNTTIDSQTSGAVVDLFGWSTSETGFGIKTSETSYPDYHGSFVEWGKNIGDGSTWRTLRYSEWNYLYKTLDRMTNGKPCYTNAMSGVTIGGTTYKGIFLYPDNYNGDEVSSTMSWEQINAAGIVFLPAAGQRSGSNVENIGSEGYYRTSNYLASAPSSHYLFFDSSNITSLRDHNLYFGYSVRLVTDCQ